MKKLTICVLFCISAFLSSCTFLDVAPQSRLIDVETLDLLSFALTEDTTGNIYNDTTFVHFGDTTLNTINDSSYVIYGDTSSVIYEDSTLISNNDSTFITFKDTTIIAKNNKVGEIKVEEIEVSDLPTKVKNYIDINFSESNIKHAATLENGSFIVRLTKKNENSIGLKFDLKGDFISKKISKSQSLPIPISEIPSNIVTFIKSNYQGSTILFANQFDSTYRLLVKNANNTIVGVGFSSNGKLLAEMIFKNN